jgi:hypothetical protein
VKDLTKRALAATGVSILVLGGYGAAEAAGRNEPVVVTDSLTRTAPRCDKSCQKRNDVFFKADGYTDYFVYDSDGKKDDVFAIYHDVPFPAAGEGVRCDVLKVYEDAGVGVTVVCPGPQVIAMGSASSEQKDDDG